MEKLDEWKVKKKKEAYELYADGQLSIDDYHMRLKLIDEI